MASFSSEIMNFNPYIQQVPVDDYMRVGLAKQQQYDAGVQQVQSSISNIAGLDIMNDNDKQYVQSALGKLQTQLQQLGSADYSHQSLVNQITGATSQITADKNIRNAVMSTTHARKEMEFMEQQRKEGKSSVENEWDFNGKLAGYLNSGKVGQVFQDKYIPYRDVRKKALEIIKSIDPNARITDDLFTPDGKLSDVMLRRQFKGKSGDQIKEALMAGLDESDLQQLSISGRYQMQNYDVNDLAKVAFTQTGQQKQFLNEQMKALQDTQKGIASTVEKTKIQGQIDIIGKQLEKLGTTEKFYTDNLQKGNLDAVRGQLSSEQFFNQFGNAFQNTELSETYLDNPARKVQMERETLQMKHGEWLADYNLTKVIQQENLIEKEKDRQFRLRLKQVETGALGLGGTPSPIDQSMLPDVNVDNFVKKTEGIQRGIDAEEAQFLTQNKLDKEGLKKQRALYDQGVQLTKPMMNYFSRRADQEAQVYSDQQLLRNLEADADLQKGTLNQFVPKDLQGKGFTIGTNGHQPVRFSTEDLVKFTEKWSNLYLDAAKKSIGNPSSPNKPALNEDLAHKILTPKEQILYDIRKRDFYGQNQNSSSLSVVSMLNRIQDEYSKNAPKFLKERNEYINNELTKRTGVRQGVAHEIPAGDTKLRTTIETKFGNLIDNAKKMGESFGSDSQGADYKKLLSIQADPKNTYSLVVQGKNQYQDPQYWLQVVNPKTGPMNIKIDPETKYAIFGNRWESPVSPEYDDIEQTMNYTGNGSTNFNGYSDPVKSFPVAKFQQSKFTNVKYYRLSGDMNTQFGRNFLSLYIYNPKTSQLELKTYAPDEALMDQNQAVSAIKALDDVSIFQLLNDGRKPTAVELQELQELNKKALK